ncbi:PDZ domain-containing protein [Streptococcaceae bacterium ESL0687]|nr:PDZ domain-containing protein [Streptococcaceae bacterium ESL0687]
MTKDRDKDKDPLIQKKKKAGLFSSIHLKIFLVGLLTLVVILLPLPGYYVELPGTTENLSSMVKIGGQSKDESDGSFNLTTVAIGRANLLSVAESKFNSFISIYSSKELMGGSSDEDYNRMNLFYMENAQNTAIYEAFKLADKPFDLKYMGVYVLEVTDNSTFKNVLHVADTLTQVDGKTFESSKDLMDYVGQKSVDDQVEITFLDSGVQKTATGKIIKLSNGKNGIGISLVDKTEVKSDPEVTIDAGSIGGPSAGLMFTLEIYEQLTGEDLRHGQKIAGTGTIERDGTVGRIGGIDKKIATASKSGAKIFFAPDDEITDDMKKADPSIKTNYEEALAAAKKLKTDMKIIPVKNVNDALTYLRENK